MSQNWLFLDSLLLVRSDFSRYPTEISQAENDHSSCRNILLSTQKLFGEVISLPGPPIQLSASVAHTGPVRNFGDLVRASVLLVHYYVPASQWVPVKRGMHVKQSKYSYY